MEAKTHVVFSTMEVIHLPLPKDSALLTVIIQATGVMCYCCILSLIFILFPLPLHININIYFLHNIIEMVYLRQFTNELIVSYEKIMQRKKIWQAWCIKSCSESAIQRFSSLVLHNMANYGETTLPPGCLTHRSSSCLLLSSNSPCPQSNFPASSFSSHINCSLPLILVKVKAVLI